MTDESDSREAVILGRAAKASSRTKNWYNVKYQKPENIKGDQMSIDLGAVGDLTVVEPNREVGESEEIFITDVDFHDA